MVNPQLVNMALNGIDMHEKKAFVPVGQIAAAQGAAPGAPMDPAAAGGMPPAAGVPPMDPAMAGGAPPMDPAMMGGAPPMDPAMAGGAPPMDPMAGGAPPSGPVMLSLDDLRAVMMEAVQMAQAGGGGEGGEGGGAGGGDLEQRMTAMEDLLSQVAGMATGGGGAPAMAGGMPSAPPAPVANQSAGLGVPAPPAPSAGASDMKTAAEQHPELSNIISAIEVLQQGA